MGTVEGSRPSQRLVPLVEADCWDLLRSQMVGRIGFVDDGMPQIFPVNFQVHEGRVLFRTSPYGAVARTVTATPIAFEVDVIQYAEQAGWSVLVTGEGQHETDPYVLGQLWGPDRVAPWADGNRELWISLTPSAITGRRITWE